MLHPHSQFLPELNLQNGINSINLHRCKFTAHIKSTFQIKIYNGDEPDELNSKRNGILPKHYESWTFKIAYLKGITADRARKGNAAC